MNYVRINKLKPNKGCITIIFDSGNQTIDRQVRGWTIWACFFFGHRPIFFEIIETN